MSNDTARIRDLLDVDEATESSDGTSGNIYHQQKCEWVVAANGHEKGVKPTMRASTAEETTKVCADAPPNERSWYG